MKKLVGSVLIKDLEFRKMQLKGFETVKKQDKDNI